MSQISSDTDDDAFEFGKTKNKSKSSKSKHFDDTSDESFLDFDAVVADTNPNTPNTKEKNNNKRRASRGSAVKSYKIDDGSESENDKEDESDGN